MKINKATDDLLKAGGLTYDQVNKTVNLNITAIKKTIEQYPDKIIDIINARMDYGFEVSKGKGPTISCKKGCSNCCYINVGINNLEAKRIISYVKDKKIKLDIDKLEVQKDMGVDDYSRLDNKENSRCVFLNNNVCSIHEVRPIACKKYFVSSHPKDCGTNKKVLNAYFYDAELLESACYNVFDYGNMPNMLLKELNDRTHSLKESNN